MARTPTIHRLTAFNKIFFFILLLWIALSFFNIFYNFEKAITEEKQWIFLSNLQKREKIFGDIYLFFTFINKNTSTNAHIILYPHTEELFYFGIYNLHPRKIATAKDYAELVTLSQNQTYTYIATYNKKISLKNFMEIASSSTSKDNWTLYKRL